jgi:sodium transport system permease protein
MNMKPIFTVFRKELTETLRDRRTMLAMIIIPILVFPLILWLMTTVNESFDKKSKEETFSIALISENHGSDFMLKFLSIPDSLGPKKIFFYDKETNAEKLIASDSIQVAFSIPGNFDSLQKGMNPAEISIYFKETNMGARQRAQLYAGLIENQLKQERMEKLEMSPEILAPLSIKLVNLSSEKEMIGKYAGGFLPYLFIIFGFIGCLYPAIDLFTGEKERKTLETLLTAPVPRWKLLAGKMMVVVFSGMLAATSALIGLYVAIHHLNFISDPSILEVIDSILNVTFIGLLFLLMLPLTIFFAGIMIPITVNANSFKEAQSILTPINFLIILPAMIGFIPGIELTASTALIPVVNVVLASKDLMAGTLSPFLLGITFLTMLVFALLAVLLSYRKFGSEESIVK